MPTSFGPDAIKEVRFENMRIAKVYCGADLVYSKPYVKLKFYFDNTPVNPRNKVGTVAKAAGAEWLSSSDPHIWYLITPLYTKGAATTDTLLGLGKLFCGDASSSEGGLLLESALGTCQVLEITGDYDKIETLDRMFQRCTAITSISKTGFYDKFANSTALVNVSSICRECTGITDGSSLNGYNVFHQIPTISTHADSFTQADSTANLAQIPTSWGGTMAPPSTQVACTKTNNAGWLIDLTDPNCPDFANVSSLEVFTTSSVSSFAQVNMKKSNIWNKTNSFSTSAATYYFPAFIQGTGTWPTAGTSTFSPSWVFAPGGYNGMLPAGTAQGDMAGTLDHELYGPFTCKYGTFDSTKPVYFCFLVLNDPANIEAFDSATTAFGIHSNQYFQNFSLNWFIPA